jgi:hypothetical protein
VILKIIYLCVLFDSWFIRLKCLLYHSLSLLPIQRHPQASASLPPPLPPTPKEGFETRRGAFPEEHAHLMDLLASGQRTYGLGADDTRPAGARPLLNGALGDVLAAQQKLAVESGRGSQSYILYVEDFLRGGIRFASWDNFYRLKVHCVGQQLFVSEDYSSPIKEQFDHSAIGEHLQGLLKDDVKFIHISINRKCSI